MIERFLLVLKIPGKDHLKCESQSVFDSVSVSLVNITRSVFHCLVPVFLLGHNRWLLNIGFLRKLET